MNIQITLLYQKKNNKQHLWLHFKALKHNELCVRLLPQQFLFSLHGQTQRPSKPISFLLHLPQMHSIPWKLFERLMC